MRKVYSMVLVSAGIFLAISALSIMAEEETGKQVKRVEGERIWGEFEPTEEMIDRMMKRLEESEPEKAEELAELRKKKPEKFREEIQKVFREYIEKRVREQQGFGGFGAVREGGRGVFGGPGGRERREREGQEARPARTPERRPSTRPRMRGGMWMSPEEEKEFMKWLEADYPDEAKKLSELKEGKPELYERQKRLILMRYIRIWRAAQENPELGEILKEQHELNEEEKRILQRISKGKDEREKEELIERLREVLSEKFDLIVRRKQIAYEQLRKRLKELEKYVRESEANVEKWQEPEFKEEQVRARIQELVGRTEPFDWD